MVTDYESTAEITYLINNKLLGLILIIVALAEQHNSVGYAFLYNFYRNISKNICCWCNSFLDTKENRYNPLMGPTVPTEKWRKGSQVLLQN